jgi:hypothetical protein
VKARTRFNYLAKASHLLSHVKLRQYLTPAIVPDGYDSDEPTTDADITMVAHANFTFDPLDGSASHGTPDSDVRAPLTLT